jgi:sterol desaturase/sphingolipid hydroxylase (fatty acid hydroxylase superfamily)
MPKMVEPKPNEFSAPDWVKESETTSLAVVTLRKKVITTLIIATVFAFCTWAGWFELGRARSGNWRAWVYSFEWPLFAGISIYLWHRIIKGDPIKMPKPDFSQIRTIPSENNDAISDGKDF